MATPTPTPAQNVPALLMRATVYQHGRTATITGYRPIRHDRLDGSITPMEAFWGQQQCLLMEEGDKEMLIHAIHSGTVVAVSNGSFKDWAGAAAWTIEGAMVANRIVGNGLTPGEPEDQSAYRSELFGLWGIFASLKQLSDTNNIDHEHVLIACDGQSALKKAQCTYPTEPEEAHYDLISAIKNLRRSLPFSTSFVHVKGHQDQGATTVLLRLAWMNIEMDLLA